MLRSCLTLLALAAALALAGCGGDSTGPSGQIRPEDESQTTPGTDKGGPEGEVSANVASSDALDATMDCITADSDSWEVIPVEDPAALDAAIENIPEEPLQVAIRSAFEADSQSARWLHLRSNEHTEDGQVNDFEFLLFPDEAAATAAQDELGPQGNMQGDGAIMSVVRGPVLIAYDTGNAVPGTVSTQGSLTALQQCINAVASDATAPQEAFKDLTLPVPAEDTSITQQ